MARAYQPAEAVLKSVLADAVNPALKAAKFKKTALNYHRRHGETVQVGSLDTIHNSPPRCIPGFRGQLLN